jgi:hypothetical protein
LTAIPFHAADHPCRELKNAAPGKGIERSRTAAHSLILRNPADVVRTTPRTAVYRISAGWRAGDSYCRLSLKGVTARNLETNLPAPYSHRAACPLSGSVIASVLPVAGIAGSLLPFWRSFRLFQFIGRIYRAVRTRFPLRFNSSQEPKRRVTQVLKSFSSVLCHGKHHVRRMRQSAVKE